jgi:hypothetical protein
LSAEPDLGSERGVVRGVTVTRVPLWRLRLAHGVPRGVLSLAACAGLIASMRFAVFPPRGAATPSVAPAAPAADQAAEGYAVLFARRYLTWDAADPQSSERLLESTTGSKMAVAAGLALPPSGAQHVLWAEVVQQREPHPGAHVYTVAAQTDRTGLVYLAVAVSRASDGSLVLSGYPAFVGAPAHAGARLPAAGPPVDDAGLVSVVRRALRNYLAASADELDADLASDAHVAVPGVALSLDAVQSIVWSIDRRSVVTLVEARDAGGARYTLGYELDVADVNGRWEISAVEMDPYR